MNRTFQTVRAAGLLAAAAMALAACSQDAGVSAEPASQQGDGPDFRFGMGGGPGVDKSGDAQLQALKADVAPRFRQFTYVDEETGLTIPYNLFIPAAASDGPGAGRPLPMVTFIADASTVGGDLAAPLDQGWGGLIWASDEEQARNPSFVLVPQFPEVTIDDHGDRTSTPYIEATRRMIEAVAAEHGVDTRRLYATGQSMGCMMFLTMSAQHPDLFAGQLFVSGQWDIAALGGLVGEHFVYITSAGDEKASTGQNEVRAMLEQAGAAFASGRIDGKADLAAQEAAVRAALAEGRAINLLTFEAGSVLPEGVTQPGGAGDHMYSFDPAYRLAPLRDWLFAQRAG